MSKTSFDFNGVEAAKLGNYLKPGRYKVRVSDVETGVHKQSQIPYMAVTFTTQDKKQFTEKFNLGAKAGSKSTYNPLSRLQYLHEAWLGEPLNAKFNSLQAVADYFKKALVSKKAGVKVILLKGEKVGKVVYGRLDFTNFLVTDEDAELGEFAVGSDEYKANVEISARTSEVAGKKNGLLNASDDEDDFGDDEDEDTNDDEDTNEDADDSDDVDENEEAEDEDAEEEAEEEVKTKKKTTKPAAKPEAKKADKKVSGKKKDDDDFDW